MARAEPLYRYGDFPHLFQDARPDEILDPENPVVLTRILEQGRLEDVHRLLSPELIRRQLDTLPLAPHSRWFWRLVVDGTHAPG